MTTYVAIPPAAVLPADGKAKKLRLHNPSYNSANPQSALFADFDFSEERFSIGTSNAKGALFLANTVIIPDLGNAAGQPYLERQKSFFEWLTLYQGKALAEAQVFIGEEKTRAEDAEGVLEQAISDEKTRAEDAEGVLQSAIDANTTAIANILNASPEHLNQLTELVADYTANGATITTALQAEATYARAAEADLRTRVAALETLIADLIQQQQPQ